MHHWPPVVPYPYSDCGGVVCSNEAALWAMLDHCYARNSHLSAKFLRPTRTLFIAKSFVRRPQNPLAPLLHTDNADFVDVDGVAPPPKLIYDCARAKELMEECQRHATLGHVDDSVEDWEERVSKLNWGPTQHRLFSGIVNILNSHHLATLAFKNTHYEAISQRTIIDKSVARVRKLFAVVAWDTRYTQWLHCLLIEKLSLQYLIAYLNILQTLKSKLPTFVDKFMATPASSKLNMFSYESLFPLLKSAWDPIPNSGNDLTSPTCNPALSSASVEKSRAKLPGNPIIIFVHTVPYHSKRMRKFVNLLADAASVVTLPPHCHQATPKMAMTTYVDQLYVSLRCKIQEVRTENPNRHIVLVGMSGGGAALALQAANVEQHVLCVCVLGFSLFTADGRRGDPDDNLLELQCPVLFVIGQFSSTSFQEDMEELRERMRVETSLVIVGGADDHLRINKKVKRAQGLTQSVVDRSVADEVSDFIGSIIMSPYPPQLRQSPPTAATAHVETGGATPSGGGGRKKAAQRKRYSSNTSSLDSEPPSPTPRITRPVGRPPGSKTKAKRSSGASGIKLSSPATPPNATPIVSNETVSFSSPTTQNETVKSSSHFIGGKSTNGGGGDLYSGVAATSTTTIGGTQQPPPLVNIMSDVILTPNIPPHTPPLKKIKTLKPLLPPLSSVLAINPTTTSPTTTKPTVFTTTNTTPPAKRRIFTGKYSPKGSNNPPKIVLPNGILDFSQSYQQPHFSEQIQQNFLENYKIVGPSRGRIQKAGVAAAATTTVKKLPSKTSLNPIILFPEGHYITSKKQLLNQKFVQNFQLKKSPLMDGGSGEGLLNTSSNSNLLTPTNLSSQDIMDLPIIFADDNQMIADENNSNATATNVVETAAHLTSPSPTIQQINSSPTPPLPSAKPLMPFNQSGKVILINKPLSNLFLSKGGSCTLPLTKSIVATAAGVTTTTAVVAATAVATSGIPKLATKFSKVIFSSATTKKPITAQMRNANIVQTVQAPPAPPPTPPPSQMPPTLAAQISSLSSEISIKKVDKSTGNTTKITTTDVLSSIVMSSTSTAPTGYIETTTSSGEEGPTPPKLTRLDDLVITSAPRNRNTNSSQNNTTS